MCRTGWGCGVQAEAHPKDRLRVCSKSWGTPEGQAEGVQYRLRHTRKTGWRCAVQAEGVQYRLRDAEQRVSFSLYCTSLACTSGVLQPVLHTLSLYCTYFIQGNLFLALSLLGKFVDFSKDGRRHTYITFMIPCMDNGTSDYHHWYFFLSLFSFVVYDLDF